MYYIGVIVVCQVNFYFSHRGHRDHREFNRRLTRMDTDLWATEGTEDGVNIQYRARNVECRSGRMKAGLGVIDSD